VSNSFYSSVKEKLMRRVVTFVSLLFTGCLSWPVAASVPSTMLRAALPESLAATQVVDYVERQLSDLGECPEEGIRFRVEINGRRVQLVMLKKLDITVVGSALRTYRGSVDGRPATFVKDTDQLIVVLPGATEPERLVFDREPGSGPRRVVEARGRESVPVNRPRLRRPRSVALAEPKPLRIYVFIHDDVGTTSWGSIHADYFSWWARDLQERLGSVIGEVQINFVSGMRGVTDMNYRSLPNTFESRFEAFDGFIDRAMRIVTSRGLHRQPDYSPSRTKFILLTRHKIFGKSGIGQHEGDAAFATMSSYYTPAHELGHTLGAMHEAGEVRYQNAWWCETNMVSPSLDIRTACRVYSEANIANIRAYLTRSP
jgi:hypothetical protein